MWMIDPKFLCDKHLLGEHGEIHKFRHTFVKQYRIDGRISPVVQIEPASMQVRHSELAAEMARRGFNHNSDYILPDLDYMGEKADVKVNINISTIDLINRCAECAKKGL